MIEKPAKKSDSKSTAQGTPVGMRVPPKLLARIDAIIARQPDPKPRRGQVIKMLVWEALKARGERQKDAPEKP